MLKLGRMIINILSLALLAVTGSLSLSVSLTLTISPSAQAATSASDQEKYNSLTAQLKTLPAMRVYMSFAPGSGHQYATMTVMRYMRHLGYTGEFDLVYADDMQSKNPDLLKKLFPFMKEEAKSQKQCSISLKLCVSSLTEFQKDSNRPKLPYGITGADDGHLTSSGVQSIEYIGAQDLKVAKYIMLQPLDWGSRQGIDTEGQAFLTKSFPGAGLAFFNAAENFREAKGALEKMESSPSTQKEGRNLRYIFENIEKYDIQTLYGIGLIPQIPEVVSLLGAAVAGLSQYSQRMNSLLFTQRPKLMLVFSNLNEFERTFSAHALGVIDSDLQLLAKSKLSFHSIEDAKLIEKLSTLNSSEQVAIIQVSRAEQSLYHFFKKASDIPAVVAGKNALDEARTMGVPFFNSVNDYPEWYIETDDANFQQPSQIYGNEIKELVNVTRLIARGRYDEKILNQVRNLMVQSFIPQSNYYKLFRVFEMNDQNRQYRFDKIAQMLMFAFTGAMQ